MQINSYPTGQLSMLPSTKQQAPAVVVKRIDQTEYKAIEKAVYNQISAEYRGSDPGALGVKVGADMVLRRIREAIVIG